MPNQSIREMLMGLEKEQLVELIEMHSKSCIALDGVWFQSIEREEGMDAAMQHDANAWERFTVTEAKRIKAFLGLGEHPGLEGLEQALCYRFYANLNEHEIERDGNRLVYTMRKCRVQTARERKGMPFHPCKSVGILEYGGFGSAIDDRITCRCLSCYPDVTDDTCCCKWEYTLDEA
jgi:hypothetical protein